MSEEQNKDKQEENLTVTQEEMDAVEQEISSSDKNKEKELSDKIRREIEMENSLKKEQEQREALEKALKEKEEALEKERQENKSAMDRIIEQRLQEELKQRKAVASNSPQPNQRQEKSDSISSMSQDDVKASQERSMQAFIEKNK